MQYLALITINRLYDLYVYHNLINPGRYHACYVPLSRRQLNFHSPPNISETTTTRNTTVERSTKSSRLSNLLRRLSRENDDRRVTPNAGKASSSSEATTTTSPRDPSRPISKRWVPLYSHDNLSPASHGTPSSSSTVLHSPKEPVPENPPHPLSSSSTSKCQLLNAETPSSPADDTSNPIYTYEPFSLLYQIEPGQFLRLMRTRLDAHRNEFNNRPKCVPSTRSPLCSHHCVVILAARILAILCQDHSFQLRLIGSKENLTIILDMLNINNDPVTLLSFDQRSSTVDLFSI